MSYSELYQEKKTSMSEETLLALMKLPAFRYMKAPVDTASELYNRYYDGLEKGAFCYVFEENTFYAYIPRGKKWKKIAAEDNITTFFDLDSDFIANDDILVWDHSKEKFILKSGNIWNKIKSSVSQVTSFFNEVDTVPEEKDETGIYFVDNSTLKGLYLVLSGRLVKIFNSTDWYTPTEIDNKVSTLNASINKKADKADLENLSGGLVRKGSVKTVADLPTSGNVRGDAYFVENSIDPETGKPYIWQWDGERWNNTLITDFPSDMLTGADLNFAVNAYSTTDNVRFTENAVYIKKEGFSIVNNYTGNQHNIVGDSDFVINFSDMLDKGVARRFVYIDTTKLVSTTSKFEDVFISRDDAYYSNRNYILFLYGYRNIVHPTVFSIPMYARYLNQSLSPNRYLIDFGNTGQIDTIEIEGGEKYDTLVTSDLGLIVNLEGNSQYALKNILIQPLDSQGEVQYRYYVYVDINRLVADSDNKEAIVKRVTPIYQEGYILIAYFFQGRVQYIGDCWGKFVSNRLDRIEKNFSPNRYIVDFGNTGSTDTFDVIKGNKYDTLSTSDKGVMVVLEGNEQYALKNLLIQPLDSEGEVQYRYYVYVDINRLVADSDNRQAIITRTTPLFSEGYILFGYFFEGRLQYIGNFWGKLIDDRVTDLESQTSLYGDLTVAFKEEDNILDFTDNQVRIKRSSLPYMYQKSLVGFINKVPPEDDYIVFTNLLSQGHNRTFLEINLEVLFSGKIENSTDIDTEGLFVLHGGAPYLNSKYEVLAMWYYDKLMPIGVFGPHILRFQHNNSNAEVLSAQLSKLKPLMWELGTSNGELLSFLHISDIHNDSTRMQYAVDVLNKYPLSFAILTGDIVNFQYSNIFGIKSILQNSSKPVYITIGNHDVYVPEGEAEKGGNNTDIYNRYIEPFESKWGIDTKSKCYYFFDIPDKKVRIINLYQYEADQLSEDKQSFLGNRVAYYLTEEQIDWFTGTLLSTPEEYGVLIAGHDKPYIIQKEDDHIWCDRFASENLFRDNTDTQYANILPAIVDAWIKKEVIQWNFTVGAEWLGYSNTIRVAADFSKRNNSIFIGWLFGHYHSDYISTIEGYPEQSIFCIAAGIQQNAAGSGDLYRDKNDYSQHCFNIVTIDLQRKYTKILRIGAYLTTDGKKRKQIISN